MSLPQVPAPASGRLWRGASRSLTSFIPQGLSAGLRPLTRVAIAVSWAGFRPLGCLRGRRRAVSTASCTYPRSLGGAGVARVGESSPGGTAAPAPFASGKVSRLEAARTLEALTPAPEKAPSEPLLSLLRRQRKFPQSHGPGPAGEGSATRGLRSDSVRLDSPAAAHQPVPPFGWFRGADLLLGAQGARGRRGARGYRGEQEDRRAGAATRFGEAVGSVT